MNPFVYRTTFSIFLTAIAMIATESRAQTIELRSSRIGDLAGPERERFLAAHNAARKAVEVESVTWSDELSQYALESLTKQKDTLIESAKAGWDKGKVALPTHRPAPKYGENIAGWISRPGQTADWAITLWLREKTAFDKLNTDSAYRVGDEVDKTETDSKGQERPIIVGHYTAIVWRNTKQLGAAKLEFELTDDKGHTRHYTALICNYNPPGNRRGDKPY